MDLQQRVNELEDEIRQLKALVNALSERQGPAHPERDRSPGEVGHVEVGHIEVGHVEIEGSGSSRRNFFRTAAIGTAGLVAGTAVAGSVALAPSAAAADGQPLLLGTSGDGQNVATTPTRIRYDGTGLLDRNVMTVTDSDTVSSSNPSAIAGYASTDARNGVYGFTTSSDGYGVVAINGNGGAGAGLWARALGGVAARLEGGKANALLVPGATAGPVSGAHERGELANDAGGDLWLCVNSGNPGTWRKLAGPSSAGALHVLATPTRVYDSRNDPSGRIAAGATRTIALNPTAGIPGGATAAMMNITLVNTVGGGFLTVFSAALTSVPGTSSVNWFESDQILSNLQVSAIDSSARIKIYSGANVTDVIVDVIGYCL
ncbi:MAG: hypothetical protein AB7V43_04790 [Acidimicrobiia bacterium]